MKISFQESYTMIQMYHLKALNHVLITFCKTASKSKSLVILLLGPTVRSVALRVLDSTRQRTRPQPTTRRCRGPTTVQGCPKSWSTGFVDSVQITATSPSFVEPHNKQSLSRNPPHHSLQTILHGAHHHHLRPTTEYNALVLLQFESVVNGAG